MIKVGDILKTRDGCQVEITEAGPDRLRGIVSLNRRTTWSVDGKWAHCGKHNMDLMMDKIISRIEDKEMGKIEVGKTYLTRNGKAVRILATDLKDTQPVVGAILYEDGTENLWIFLANGKFWSHPEPHDLDIIIMPERKSGWLNWYGTDNGAYIYRTRNDAESAALSGRTRVLEIITEDNEPVEIKIHKVEQ